jgi:hypothetical protein
MESLLGWIEATPLRVWTRESTSVWAFPAILSAHAIGMALAAGISAAIALNLLGVGSRTAAREMRPFVGLVWAGFLLNAASGVVLLIAYPTKALTNPVFYLKLLLIGLAMAIFVAIDRRLFRDPAPREPWSPGRWRALAVVSLVSWTGAITAGRLLAYTYRHLFVDF